jgi:hypothetical protein
MSPMLSIHPTFRINASSIGRIAIGTFRPQDSKRCKPKSVMALYRIDTPSRIKPFGAFTIRRQKSRLAGSSIRQSPEIAKSVSSPRHTGLAKVAGAELGETREAPFMDGIADTDSSF